MSLTVVHAPEQTRYELVSDGETIGLADYTLSGNTISFTHTEIDPARREKGLGGTLVRGALDDVRDTTEYRVQAICPFVVSWIDNHPEYQDLLKR